MNFVKHLVFLVIVVSATAGTVAAQDSPKQSQAVGQVASQNTGQSSIHSSDAQTIKGSEDLELQRKLAKFTKWLVIVGAFQFVALIVQAIAFWYTLGAIRTQANLMGVHAGHLNNLATAAKNNAEAASLNAESVMNSERAWLVMQPDTFKLEPSRKFDWVIKNVGKTTARIVETNMRCRKCTSLEKILADPPEYKDPICAHGIPIAPGDSAQFWSYIEAQPRDSDGMTAQDVAEIQSGKAELVAYGFVKYLDSFGEEHESRFCYYYALFWSAFRMNFHAPASYHECD